MSSVLFEPLQAAIRRTLEFDPDTRERIRELDGRVVEVTLTGLERTIRVSIHGENVSLSRAGNGEPDLRLAGTPTAFARYVMAPDRVEITESGIRIEGDVGLAQRFVGVLRRLDIDWEEWASRYVGDVMAYRAGRIVDDLRAWAGNSGRQFRQDVTEYLQEEARFLAPRREVERVLNEIDTTRSDVERLAQRIKRLQDLI